MRIDDASEKSGAYGRDYTGGAGGSSAGGTGSAPGVPAHSFVAGDRIKIEETPGVNKSVIKISHEVAKEENEDSQTLNEKGYFVKCLHLDKEGHIVKVEVEEIAGTFDERYLRKDQPDETNFKITFRQGADFGDFVEGFLGSGGRIDENGNCWFGGMRLRDFLEVPELRFNRIDVVSGELWNSIAFGLIESVDTSNRIVTLKLEEGELSGLHVNDLCRGIFHNLAGNATTPGVDGCGFDKLPGFSTSYFMPVQILDNKRFKYILKPGTTVHPCAAMKFAVYGNTTDTSRQSSAYHTRNYVRYLCDVDTWEIKPQHIGVQMGDLSGLVIDGQNLGGKSIYLDNVYFGKNILQTPGLKESLKGKDGYTVGLDHYTQTCNAASGNHPAGVSFNAFASKADKPLAYSGITGEGKYTLSVKSASGCTVSQNSNTFTLTSFTAPETATVKVTVNCEGLVSYELTFVATKVKNGQNGQPGSPGAKGDIMRNIYRRSEYQPSPPTGTYPTGWQFDPPPAGSRFLWMSQARFTATGVLISAWSTPVKITGEKGERGAQGSPGAPGQPGASGPMPCMRGGYDSSKTYQGTSFFVDVVLYNNRYYRAKPTAGVFSGVHPSNSSKWELLNSFENVATKLLIAEEANIAGWLFNKNHILSQNRNVGLDGSADSKPRFWAGAGFSNRENAPFRVYENGKFYAKEGKIGQFSIGEGGLYASNKEVQGYVYGNPKGLWLTVAGRCRVCDSAGNRFGLFSCTHDTLLDLRISHTYEKFITCAYSGGGSFRSFEIMAKRSPKDVAWYRRWFIRISHLPFRNHIPPGHIAHHMGPGDYQLWWNAETGYVYIK